VPKRIEEYAAAMVKGQPLIKTDSEDSDDDIMGPESRSAESRSINAGLLMTEEWITFGVKF